MSLGEAMLSLSLVLQRGSITSWVTRSPLLRGSKVTLKNTVKFTVALRYPQWFKQVHMLQPQTLTHSNPRATLHCRIAH